MFIVVMLWTATATAQQRTNRTLDSIAKKMVYYARKNPAELMFVHLDKTIYTGAEEMWFTAYTLNCPPEQLAKHHVLCAALINDDDNTVVATDKFVSAGRLAFGSLAVPDTVAPGNYTFIAYTNRKINGKPAAFFAQPITIKTAAQPVFNVAARIDTTLKSTDGVGVSLRGATPDGALVGASVSYVMGANKQTRVNGKGKTNAIGDYEFIIPRDRIKPDQHILEINVKKGTEVKTVKLFMPLPRAAHHIKFYPEGGNLVAGMVNRIAWEAKNAGGSPLKATAVLFENNKPVDTINTDSFGMGTFSLQASAAKQYKVKLISPLNIDTAYGLPAAKQTGVTIHMPNALANDTLRFALNALQPRGIYVLVHNYNQNLATTFVQLAAGKRSVMVDLSQLPRGLNSITLLDSAYRPFAERLFFAHYNQKVGININTNSQEYGLRKKVELSLKLKSVNGKPLHGIVSVACVQDNRFDLKKDNNIENYVYLRSAIDNLPLKDKYWGDEALDRQYLNELLLVRGWSKYKWLDMEKAVAPDTIQKQDSMAFTAKITKVSGRLKKPALLLVLRDSVKTFEVFNSDAQGDVSLTDRVLMTGYGKKLRLAVSGQSSDFIVKLTDPYREENKAIAARLETAYFGEPPAEVDTRALVLKGMERATHLREVKIVARKDTYLRSFGGVGANKCGDYICMNRILNCMNHRFDMGNRAPAPGEMVHMRGSGLTPYSGCASEDLDAGMIAVKGIYEAKEFYGADYSVINPTEPDFLSTLCWKHAISISSETDTKFSFYTSDITGAYRIVVQGITDDDVLYGDRLFTVKKQLP